MKTTLIFWSCAPASALREQTWSRISPAVRLRRKSPFAVSQKTQSSGQPTCEDTHSVVRWGTHQYRLHAGTVLQLEEELAGSIQGGLLHGSGLQL
jgi:hypothetical protein